MSFGFACKQQPIGNCLNINYVMDFFVIFCIWAHCVLYWKECDVSGVARVVSVGEQKGCCHGKERAKGCGQGKGAPKGCGA